MSLFFFFLLIFLPVKVYKLRTHNLNPTLEEFLSKMRHIIEELLKDICDS